MKPATPYNPLHSNDLRLTAMAGVQEARQLLNQAGEASPRAVVA